MGLEGFYPWLRKKRGYNPTLRNSMHYHLPHNSLPTIPTIRVNILSFFHKIREIYTTHADNKQLAHSILLEHIKKYGNPLRMRMAFYVDGAPAFKKRETRLKRNEKQVKDFKNAKIAIETLSNHPSASNTSGSPNGKRAAAGTSTNANQLPSSEQQQQREASACILDIVGQVCVTKRHTQEFLGAFIETIFERGLTETDRISSSAGTPAEDEGEEDAEDEDEEVAEDDGDEDAEPSAMDKPFIAFYQILLAHIYSRKIKSKAVVERQVGQLLARATFLGITLPSVPLRNVSYPTNRLLELASKQLYRSINMMYRNGSVVLEKKINSQADGQPGTVLPKVDSKLPAIENYLLLNKASGGSRRIAPLSPLAARYVDFSERHLLPLFWSWPTFKDKIRRMMVEDRYFQDPAIVPAQADALNWLTKTTPGRLVTTFLTDVGLPSDKHDKGYRKVTAIMDLDGKNGKEGLREHLACLRAETFDPKEWHGRGYILRGSIRTNGRLLQVLAFKLKELQSVRYRRVPENKLPNPFLTTIGGTNRYLTETRNVFSTSAAVESLLAADP
ncbi:hypothetical protein BGZ47_001441, partial [Haplosporangium gracile]